MTQFRGRRGSITILTAICMLGVLSVMALVLDGGLMMDRGRKLQNAADAAALAAASDLWEHYGINGGLDPSGTAQATALSTAAANGFNNDGITNSVTVNIAPTSGPFSGTHGYAEVIISLKQNRGFSSLWASDSLGVRARAVAGGTPGDVAVLMLNPHETVAAQIGDNVNIAGNGQIYINSDGTVFGEFGKDHGNNAIYVESSGHLTTGGINTVAPLFIEAGGTVTYTGGGGLRTGISPIADPLAGIAEPVTTGMTNYGSNTYSSNATILPGIYKNITVNTNVTLTMSPGVYVVTGGNMTLKAGASVVGSGVMLYNMPDGYFDIPLTASVTLSPPTTGSFRGISVFEPRLNGKEVHIKTSGTLTMSGTLYSQTGEFDLRPQTAGSVMNFGSYVADLAEWSPPPSLGTINLNPGSSAPTKRPLLVQ